MNTAIIMIVTLIVDPTQSEAKAYYLENAFPLFVAAGGVPMGRYQVDTTLIGNTQNAIAVMEFPSQEALENVLNSEAYKRLVPYRDKAFTEINMHIAAKPE